MGALKLVERGALSLHENVNAKLRSWHVPENRFTQTEKVTLRVGEKRLLRKGLGA